jgi:hypothetical protein
MSSGQPQPALLFMPDISGFTQFVNETEILHSQHIIQELLEILIDSNRLNLQVCEVEGDAIFFYKLGEKPGLQTLLRQVEIMFTRFHAHLSLYQHQRICPCAACKTAVNLSLKIIVHFGEVTGIAVKEHKKLFGRDVILLHRLLKNKLERKEYVLLTEKLVGPKDQDLPSWYLPQKSAEQYDVGEVQFYFSDLCDLHKTVKVNSPIYNSASKTYVAFAEKEIIAAPMETIFETILDMQQKMKLAADGRKSDTILRIGEKHPCLITKNNSRNITESVNIEAESIEMVEMNQNGIAGYRYLFRKLSGKETNLSIQVLIRNNPLFKIAFSIAIKPKMVKRIQEFFVNLKEYLKKVQVSELNF